MPGIWGDGPRGGIFGARIDPALLRELEKRAEAKRNEIERSTLGGRAKQWWDKSTFFKPAYEELVGGATVFGDVMSGAQPTMAMDPQTGEFHSAPELMDRAGAAAGALTLGAGAIPAEANALRMGIKGFRDIRPPKEDLYETADASFTHGSVVGDAEVDIGTLKGGVRLNDPAERKRIDRLRTRMSGDEGYIERLIVDDSGNVIEGQHRLEALREMGMQNVPVSVIRDLARNVDVAKMQAAVQATGKMHPDQARQIVRNVLEMADDVGSENIGKHYSFPSGFEKAHQAAIDAIRPPRGIRAYHGSR